ncbi:MAG: electron transport complex subunit RsxA [Gammaproteobacteria bacterium]|nr:electron transport complex subunit RsxA [Gammaproteobacteria bacterium]MBT8443239.1 electron transport complex subunit RsxA [Gammaproteobacteria bacterium]NND37118.1 electron transport complex subunit RsxA [Gammaproteobacteria bacterium]
MSDLLLIILATVLVNNFVLVKFLGLCPLLGASTRVETALGMSLATTFVLTIAAGASYLIDTYLLAPFELEYLRLLAFILVIAASVQFTELFIRHSSPLLHQVLGVYLPLITTNCAVLGVALLNTQQSSSFVEALAYGIGAGLGFCLVMVLFAGLRQRLDGADVPAPFRGAAIALITAGIMSMAFIGFTGMLRG